MPGRMILSNLDTDQYKVNTLHIGSQKATVMKACKQCKKEKPLSSFKVFEQGLHPYCNVCYEAMKNAPRVELVPNKTPITRKNRRKHTHKVNLARVDKACPLWVDRTEIEQVYQDCPEGLQVDHAIPLKGYADWRGNGNEQAVSGLHVKWNMQYLTSKENREKGDYYDPFS